MACFQDKQKCIIYTALKDIILGTIKLDRGSVSSFALQGRHRPRLWRDASSSPTSHIIYASSLKETTLGDAGQLGWVVRTAGWGETTWDQAGLGNSAALKYAAGVCSPAQLGRWSSCCPHHRQAAWSEVLLLLECLGAARACSCR